MLVLPHTVRTVIRWRASGLGGGVPVAARRPFLLRPLPGALPAPPAWPLPLASADQLRFRPLLHGINILIRTAKSWRGEQEQAPCRASPSPPRIHSGFIIPIGVLTH